MSPGVRALRSVEIGTTDLDEALSFYTEIWGLQIVERRPDSAFLRAREPWHHVLAVHRAPRACMIRMVFDAADRATVDALHAAVASSDAANVEGPGMLERPGGGYGFGFTDPEGRNLAVVCEVADHADTLDQPDMPLRAAHLNLNSADAATTCGFLIERLGFRLSDETKRARFLRCNRFHNSLVISFADRPTLNHVAFEMEDIDGVMRGAGRMRDAGYPIEWGIGRHGPGNNVFAYFLGPEEFPIEYTAETMILGDDHVPGGPDDWTWKPGRSDRWGVTAPISKRFERVQRLIRFADGAWRIRG
jgi:catechol 2,3-dioxygenase